MLIRDKKLAWLSTAALMVLGSSIPGTARGQELENSAGVQRSTTLAPIVVTGSGEGVTNIVESDGYSRLEPRAYVTKCQHDLM